MKIEDLFNQSKIIDLSFFNFGNAITAAYFANSDFEILRINENFRKFFPILGNVSHALFPDVLEQLGVPGKHIETWQQEICDEGFVLIPEIQIQGDDGLRVYSLMSTRTHDDSFSYLNGIQGQFVDRTAEWELRHEREELLEQKIQDRLLIEEKNQKLENLATRLAKYLSPQIYESIFSGQQDAGKAISRKNLSVFFSDIVGFTDLSDTLEPERLAKIVNSYLSEMSEIALDCGGTIDKFIGDAILVFFGDPETCGAQEDALRAVEMGLRMQKRVAELQKYWMKLGVLKGLHVRMGITTGFCTVGNFGSNRRMDYTILGSPVNLSERLQTMAPADGILVSEETFNLIRDEVECEPFGEHTPKGFSRSVNAFQVKDFYSEEQRNSRRQLLRSGEYVEVSVFDSSDIRAAIEELRSIQGEFEKQLQVAE